MNQTKCITFAKAEQDALPEHIKAKMKADPKNTKEYKAFIQDMKERGYNLY